MGETAIIVNDVLSRVNNLYDLNTNVKTIIDFGSGTGSCLWALDNYVNNVKIMAVERESLMIKYSKILSRGLSNEIEYVQTDVLSKEVVNLSNVDLVIESFMLNELEENSRTKVVDIMCEKTNNYIILIEPGTPKSYQNMMKIRKGIIDKGFDLILPCPHSLECGLQNNYCNFSVRVPRTKMSRQVKNGTLNYEDEKYFYLVLKKNHTGDLRQNSTIIRRPVYRKGCVDLKLCNGDGSIGFKTITKRNNVHYKVARDLKHGDLMYGM